MKAMKFVYTLFLSLLMLGLGSCMEEMEVNGGEQKVDGLRLSLSVSASDVISPLTKATAADANTINDLNILVYNKDNNNLAKGLYLTDNGLNGLSVEKDTEEKAVNYDIALQNGSYRVRVIANAGSDLSTMSFDEINDLSYGVTTNLPKMVMSASADNVSVSGGRGSVVLSLKRIYAMISVSVNTTGLTNRTITPTKVSLHQVPAYGKLFTKNLIPVNPSASDYIENVEEIAFASPNNNVSSMKDNAVFFMYENMQPEGTCLRQNGEYVEAYKTPASLGTTPTKDPASVSKDKTCSYIQVEADYIDDSGTGTITYRFFLGGGLPKEVCTNFEVERNTRYNVTLNLSGKGGVDEASWRVTTDIMGLIVPHDAYVGYRVGAESRIYIDVNSDIDKNGWALSFQSGYDVINLKNASLQQDESGYYLSVGANETNVSDRAQRTGIYTITPPGNIAPKTVSVTQVIRIVDPIAFYKRASNVETVNVKVRQFYEDKNPKRFDLLKSIGAWTVTIENGDWFSIHKNSDNAQETVSGKTIEGAGGEITFDYTPNSATSTSRYGCILVKYHNNICEHRIYLRQGYTDTNLGTDVEWSLYNLKSAFTEVSYPTSTGYFFMGGITGDTDKDLSWNSRKLFNEYPFHPYKPAYNISNSNWVSANDYPAYFRQKSGGGNMVNSATTSTWGYKPVSSNRNAVLSRKQGPCPNGYVMPTYQDFVKLRDASINGSILPYVGYIYDDNPSKGWKWGEDGNARIIDSDPVEACNPAKGTLLVRKDNLANVFFSYGKGILDCSIAGSSLASVASGVNEIGVGERRNQEGRDRKGHLVFRDGYEGSDKYYYGASYWSGTPSPESDTNVEYIKFWYSLSQSAPIYVSIPTWNSNNGSGTRNDFGSFVRCIKVNR
ncbi:fimbrial protein [Parabacteroides sp.]